MVSIDCTNPEMSPPGPLAILQPLRRPADACRSVPGGGYLWNQDANDGNFPD